MRSRIPPLSPHLIHLLADGVPDEVFSVVRGVVLQKRGGLWFGEEARAHTKGSNQGVFTVYNTYFRRVASERESA